MRLLIWIVSLCMLPAIIAAQENSLYLNPDNAIGAKASLFFEDAALIQLQTNKASYFSNIAGFITTPSHFVFFDDANNSVLVFDKEGEFLFKFKKKRYKIKSIQYVRAKDAIFIVSANKNYTIPQTKAQQFIQHPGDRNFSKYFNLELFFLSGPSQFKTEALPVSRYALNEIYYFNGNYLVTNDRYNKYLKDTVAYHLNNIEGNKVVHAYFPFLNVQKLPPYYEEISISIDPTSKDSVVLVHKDFDNTVYKLTPDSLSPAYKFVFPATNTMPQDFFSTSFKNNILFTNYLKDHNKVIESYDNMIEHKNLFFFTASNGGSTQNKYMFNSANNNLYDMGKITTDSIVYFLPQKIFATIMEDDGDYLYATISNNDLIKEKATLVSKNKSLPPAMKKVLDGLNKFNNPVVIKLKTKTAAEK